MRLLEEEAFQEWKSHPLTEEYLLILAARKQSLMEQWAAGTPGAHSPEFQAQARLLGLLAAMSWDDMPVLFPETFKEQVTHEHDSD